MQVPLDGLYWQFWLQYIFLFCNFSTLNWTRGLIYEPFPVDKPIGGVKLTTSSPSLLKMIIWDFEVNLCKFGLITPQCIGMLIIDLPLYHGRWKQNREVFHTFIQQSWLLKHELTWWQNYMHYNIYLAMFQFLIAKIITDN